MLSVLYEDKDIIVVEKPAGLESQSSRGFGADMGLIRGDLGWIWGRYGAI